MATTRTGPAIPTQAPFSLQSALGQAWNFALGVGTAKYLGPQQPVAARPITQTAAASSHITAKDVAIGVGLLAGGLLIWKMVG